MARHASVPGALLLALLVVRAQGAHLRARRHRASDGAAAPEHVGEAPKLFFFVGLEGAGGRVLREVWLDNFNDFTVTRSDKFTGTVADDYAHHVLHLPGAWECKEDWEPADNEELVTKMRRLRKDEVWALQFQATWPSCKGGGGASGHGERRFHPNLVWVQYAAKEAGVDLRVVFLHKELVDCLALTCMQRGYGAAACQDQARTLRSDARELAAQVRDAAAAGPGAASCFRYPGEREVQSQVLRDIYVYNRSHIRGVFAERGAGQRAVPVEGVDVSGLQAEATTLDALCGDMEQLDTKGLNAIFEKSRQLDSGSSTGGSGADPAAAAQPPPEIGGDGPQKARLPASGEPGTLQPAGEGDHLRRRGPQPAGEEAKLRQGGPKPAGGKTQPEQGGPQPTGDNDLLRQAGPQPAHVQHTPQQGGGGATGQPTNEEEERQWELEHGRGGPEPQPANGEEGGRGSGSKQAWQPRNEEEEQEWEKERGRARARSGGPPEDGRQAKERERAQVRSGGPPEDEQQAKERERAQVRSGGPPENEQQAKEWTVKDDQWPWEEAGGGTEAGSAQARSRTLPRDERAAKVWTVRDDQWPWEEARGGTEETHTVQM